MAPKLYRPLLKFTFFAAVALPTKFVFTDAENANGEF